MSESSFSIAEDGISIFTESEKPESEFSYETASTLGVTTQFVDKFGNVWTGQPLSDFIFRQVIRRVRRI